MATMYGKGGEIIAESITSLGVEKIYGLPHPPVSEFFEYAAKKGRFIPVTSVKEMAHVCLGMALGGKRTGLMTSGTNIYECMEVLSYATSYEIPLVFIHVGRSMPGYGNPYPYQGDIDILTAGDFPPIVMSPASVEEIPLLLSKLYTLAERFMTPAIFYLDSALFHMTATVDISVEQAYTPWGFTGQEKRFFTTMHLDVSEMKKKTASLIEKYKALEQEAVTEYYMTDSAQYGVVASGVCAYIARKAVEDLQLAGKPVGLLRPITLAPFGSMENPLKGKKKVFVVEMSNMQLARRIEKDAGSTEIVPYITSGGILPDREALLSFIKERL